MVIDTTSTVEAWGGDITKKAGTYDRICPLVLESWDAFGVFTSAKAEV
jgi:hypothetical protein